MHHVRQHNPQARPLQLQPTLPRRQLLGLASCAAAAAVLPARPAAASGLLQLPINQLSNEYFLVRAGQSEAEAAGYALTNPVRGWRKERGWRAPPCAGRTPKGGPKMHC